MTRGLILSVTLHIIAVGLIIWLAWPKPTSSFSQKDSRAQRSGRFISAQLVTKAFPLTQKKERTNQPSKRTNQLSERAYKLSTGSKQQTKTAPFPKGALAQPKPTAPLSKGTLAQPKPTAPFSKGGGRAKRGGGFNTTKPNLLLIKLHNEIQAIINTNSYLIPDFLKGRQATIGFDLQTNKQISHVQLVKSSGSSQLDRLALNAVTQITPPKVKHASTLQVNVIFD